MFHSKDGVFFNRVPFTPNVGKQECYVEIVIAPDSVKTMVVDGKVETKYFQEVIHQTKLTHSELASVMASMSFRGETSETYQEALKFLEEKADKAGKGEG